MLKALKDPKPLIIFLLSVLFLSIGFYRNQWNAANSKKFRHFQKDTESLIAGRLAKSQQDGILSSGGLTGWCDRTWPRIQEENNVDQYRIYKEKLKIHSYSEYKSQIGFQGIFFSFIDDITNFSNAFNLKLFFIMTSLMSAAAISLIILWSYYEFGIIACLVLLITSLYSRWLTLFGRNLWWVIWAFYLPMIAAMFVLFYEEKTGKYSDWVSAILIPFALFIKCVFNGYEYITTTILMMMAPYVYYAYYKQWQLKKILLRAFFVLTGSAVSLFLVSTILVYQISVVEGSIGKGVDHFLFSFNKRTHGDSSAYGESYREGLQSSVFVVLKKYAEGVAVDLNNFIPNLPAWLQFQQVQFFDLILIFMAATVLSFILSKYCNNLLLIEKKRLMALVATTWFSLLAPISWFTIFKAHSYIHTHMNHITWHMPFTLFGFLLCGLLGHYCILSIIRFRYPFRIIHDPNNFSKNPNLTDVYPFAG